MLQKRFFDASGFEPLWSKERKVPRRISLTRPFYLGATEVTQSTYEAVMGSNPSYFSPKGIRNADISGQPTDAFQLIMSRIVNAIEFCQKLSEWNIAVFPTSRGGRLSQWQGSATAFRRTPSGNLLAKPGPPQLTAREEEPKILGRRLATAKFLTEKHIQLGVCRRNPFGLFDMHGQCTEWSRDCWTPSSFVHRSDIDPVCAFPESHQRKLRGWDFRLQYMAMPLCRTVLEHQISSDEAFFGFRVVLPVTVSMWRGNGVGESSNFLCSDKSECMVVDQRIQPRCS